MTGRPGTPPWAARVPAAALVPLRLFFGATFVYAGLDKLLDPAFLDRSSPASIYAQLANFARFSPLGDLIRLSEPYAALIGIGIAVAEIGVGLGALTGLVFRLAALGGALLSLLFWLSASWATHPYYFGQDLPYAAGWLVLALAGHGGLLVVRLPLPGRRPHTGAAETASPMLTRRAALEAGVVAIASVAVAAATVPLRAISAVGGGIGSPTPTPAPSSPPPGSGLAIARLNDLVDRAAVSFTVPFDAPAPLPAGDPGVVVRLPNGGYAAFDAVCPHQGCHVGWDDADSLLVCPCHGATFDPAQAGRAVAGPTTQPLTGLAIAIDPASGTISLDPAGAAG
jgi:thiosulfate dehydrogenase (quinone) large subunit